MLVRSDHSVGFAAAAAFALLQRGANLLANSTLVPETFRNNLPNCVIVYRTRFSGQGAGLRDDRPWIRGGAAAQ
jgi:hypothetical protein